MDITDSQARIPPDCVRTPRPYQRNVRAQINVFPINAPKTKIYWACAIGQATQKKRKKIMSSPEQIAQQFVTAFYQTFDSNRAGLAPLYVRTRFLACTLLILQPRLSFSPPIHSPCRPQRLRSPMNRIYSEVEKPLSRN